MDDLNYDELDPGIRRTVRWLRSLGYETCDSGDGKTKPAQGLTWEDGVRDMAHVCINLRDPGTGRNGPLGEEATHLLQRLEAIGIRVGPIGHEIDGMASIQATYDPATGSSILDLMGLDDSMLPPGVDEGE